MAAKALNVACFCGAVSRKVSLRDGDISSDQVSLSLCHCDTCRHTTGLLCTSYYPISLPDLSAPLKAYHPTYTSRRYFCGKCGCHVFRVLELEGKKQEWGVATGVVTWASTQSASPRLNILHQHIADSQDGGLSVWFHPDDQHLDKKEMESSISKSVTAEKDYLEASCSCGNIKFHITRPNEASARPRRNYPDLMFPDKTTDNSIKRNVADEKWWIQGNGTKYLAGTCACRSCRLMSGFEVQTWAFVPRANIFFHISGPEGGNSTVPLDFNTLPSGVLTSFTSSPNVSREFCGTCGATVFWHEKSPDEVVDVSVGLLKDPEGARAEKWLEWWQGRVSFAEEVGTGRTGLEAKVASLLICELEQGMKHREKCN